jgi:hypothetical protein
MDTTWLLMGIAGVTAAMIGLVILALVMVGGIKERLRK